MLKKHTLLIITTVVITSLFSCKSKINQTVNKQKQGLWIEYDTLEYIYKTVGKFKDNSEIGTWKYYYNNKLVRKEKYYKENCKTKFYYPNGRLEKKGYTKHEIKNNLNHWYYYGTWKYYDTTGKFINKKIYYKGKTADSLSQDYQEFKTRFKTN